MNWEALVEYDYNIMEENHNPERVMRGGSTFNAKFIQNWDDFRKTFKPAKFDPTLNAASREELHAFWHPLLLELTNETEKICILVPSRVPKQDAVEQAQNGQSKKASKNAQKQGKNNKPVEVALEQQVVEYAMELIRSSFPQLDYDYTSLFLGNDKQLLIYRHCNSIEKYIEKYRLPKTFEGPFEELLRIAKELYELRTQRNRAFSTFNADLLERTQKQVEVGWQRMGDRLQQFKPLFSSIIEDFLSKPKCREVILNNTPQEVIDWLKQVCEGRGQILNRFNQSDNDEYRDVLIVKLDDPRLRAFDPLEYEQKVEYVYVEPQPQPEPPKDIRDISFLKIDIQKQCYLYRIDLPSSGKYKKLAGVFIRSEHGSESYELNVDVQEGTKQIQVQLHPYRHGKSAYEIYTWNQYGFTKSTEQIVLFNELPPPSTAAPKFKNHKLYVLGQSECGLYPEHTDTEDQLVPFTYISKEYFVRDISLGNAAVACDAYGGVAGWGEMYFPGQPEEEQAKQKSYAVEELSVGNLRIDAPCLLLQKKQIRRVSCGNGYCLMVSIFGAVFSMGCNQFGQLGLGHFNNNEQNMNPAQVCKFTSSSSQFIVDVQATICGASFAITQSGQAYRWGYNQVDETQFPILDRFDSVINYSSSPLFFKSANPILIKKQHIPSSVTQIQAGNTFFVALDTEGKLYGWGECSYLGVAELKDKQENVVVDIVNPIQIAKNIERVYAGYDHCIAITRDGKILAWGNTASFSKKPKGFANTPLQVTEEYGGSQNIKMIRAGRHYTAVLTASNTIRIFGQQNGGFQRDQYPVNFTVAEISCSYENFLAVLAEIN